MMGRRGRGHLPLGGRSRPSSSLGRKVPTRDGQDERLPGPGPGGRERPGPARAVRRRAARRWRRSTASPTGRSGCSTRSTGTCPGSSTRSRPPCARPRRRIRGSTASASIPGASTSAWSAGATPSWATRSTTATPAPTGMMEAAFELVPRERIYEITGLQFLPFNTLYQLLALKRPDSPLLEVAETLLMMPDLLRLAPDRPTRRRADRRLDHPAARPAGRRLVGRALRRASDLPRRDPARADRPGDGARARCARSVAEEVGIRRG